MIIKENLICELWKQKLSFYGHRKARGAGGISLVLIILLFGIGSFAEFQKSIIIPIGLGYAIYLTVHTILSSKINAVRSQYPQSKYAQIIVALLYNIQDWGLVLILGATFWVGGLLALESLTYIASLRKASFIMLLSILIIALLLSPYKIRKKVEREASFKNEYPPLVFIYLTSLPGLALLIQALLPNIRGINTKILLFVLVSFILAPLLISYSIWAIFEFFVLCFRVWPDVNKTGSEFVISFQDDGMK